MGALALGTTACAGDGDGDRNRDNPVGGGSKPLPDAPSCVVAGGSATVSAPELRMELMDRRYESGWLSSPVAADLDGDGVNEILVARAGYFTVFDAEGNERWRFDEAASIAPRFWSSPVVADFRDDERLEIVLAGGGQVWMLDSDGNVLSGWPREWQYELRSVAAGDVNDDGQLDVIVASTRHEPDILTAYTAGGDTIAGFPPAGAGAIGCNVRENCWIAGAYDQNLAVGDLDGDGRQDIVATQDNAYTGFYRGNGELFDSNPMFEDRPKTLGVRYLHDLRLAQQGFADDESSDLQAHFTNTAPTIADIDEDGTYEVILLASVQNAGQDRREQGVGLWVVRHDATRLPGFETPFHSDEYLGGLWDLDGNIVAMTNQVTVANIDGARGKEMIYAGFDGRIHAVRADGTEFWAVTYTNRPDVFTGGVVVGDLSGDGKPEIVFATYSPQGGQSDLFILDAGGSILHQVKLPRLGSMAVPTLADVDGDGTVEILVSTRETPWDSGEPAVLVYSVASSTTGCLLWPTARGNLYRNAWVRDP
ncbi:FG-GAP repeat domain-containing protein [Chondromyces crocatus]|nr:VCBS repeat-containing protein [Chondromyces crocatus]